jgi:hypothetical protein
MYQVFLGRISRDVFKPKPIYLLQSFWFDRPRNDYVAGAETILSP